ncbi:TPA: hypothetical protein EYP66_06335 [Candidatus Poribacteria bacterium]|nr:hypothetical protein [Candidatus Poribacteria bacterium]
MPKHESLSSSEAKGQTETRQHPENIHQTKDPAVNCNGGLGATSVASLIFSQLFKKHELFRSFDGFFM